MRNRSALLAIAFVAIISPQYLFAQSSSLYTLCYEGELPRICGYDPEWPVNPLDVYPLLSDKVDIRSNRRVAGSYNGTGWTLTLSGIDGSNPEPFGELPISAGMLALSPDLTRLAYVANGVENQGQTLYVYTPETGETIPLLSGSQGLRVWVNAPEWSPDGQWLLFNVGDTERQWPALAIMKADGSEPYIQVTTPSEDFTADIRDVEDQNFDWSFAGDRILFTRTQIIDATGVPAHRLFTVPVPGDPPMHEDPTLIQAIDIPGFDYVDLEGVEWSGDDSQVALMSRYINFGPTISSGYELHTMEADGGAITRFQAESNATTYLSNRMLEWTGSRGLIVNDTGDNPDAEAGDDLCDADLGKAGEQCTLRAALQIAERQEGRDLIEFDLPGSAPYTITVSSGLPASSQPIEIDGTTQKGYVDRPLVHIHGGGADGLVLEGGDSVVRGLAIGGFSAGVTFAGAGGNTIEGSYLGLQPDGVTADGNGTGILIDGSPDHVVGGEKPEQRNVISGNTGAGVTVSGMAAKNIVVAGNRIGTTADGTFAVANGAEGVHIEDAPGVRIGGTKEAERNLISGNTTHGILVTGAEAKGVKILGNWIGVDAGGTTALANGTDDTPESGHHGIAVVSAGGTVIGGATGTPGTAPGNVIAANAANQIYVTGTKAEPADSVQVLGNLIGTDMSGAVALAGGQEAVFVAGEAKFARIGQAGGGNVIVAGATEEKPKAGVWLLDLGENTGAPDGSTIAANTIGLNVDASAVLGWMGTAVAVVTESDNGGVAGVTVGGTTEADGNRIRGIFGVTILGARAGGTAVVANTIGLLADGKLARTERDAVGITVALADQSQIVSNTVGGHVFGVVVAAKGVGVLGNRLGTDPEGTVARPNTVGIYVPGQLTDGPAVGDSTRIGGPGAGNVISGNERSGLLIGGDFSFGAGSQKREAFAAPGASIAAALQSSVRTLAPSGTPGTGSPSSVEVTLNRIGTDLSGLKELGNGRASSDDNRFAGVHIRDGEKARLTANVISGNGGGVLIGTGEDEPGNPKGVTFAGNIIGGNAELKQDIPNQSGGVIIVDSPDNTFTQLGVAGADSVGNFIVGNRERGIVIRSNDGETNNRIRHTNFLRNTGPSIQLLDESLDYPFIAAPAPALLSAVRRVDGSIVFKGSQGISGEVDIFVSESCARGNAEGLLQGVAAVVPGNFELTLPPGPIGLNDYVAMTATASAATRTTSEFSDCVRVTNVDKTFEAPVAPGSLGIILNGLGISVEATENPGKTAAGGTLVATRFDENVAPQLGLFEGSATAPDGSTVTPNDVSSNRHWTLRTDSLAGIVYTACVDVAGVGGVVDPAQLVLVHRADAGDPWTPYNSTLDGSTLCAEGLASWGDIGIGADSLVQAVAIEPPAGMLPHTLALEVYPNPARDAATVSLALPASERVQVAVYDALGRRVAVLQEGTLAAGMHTLSLSAGGLPSGLYLVRAVAGVEVLTTRVTLVR
ncbi:MAG: T9SS type A sorting domain-containing protein [Rhodothermales bacterium]